MSLTLTLGIGSSGSPVSLGVREAYASAKDAVNANALLSAGPSTGRQSHAGRAEDMNGKATLGLILNGGQARRMSGADKGLVRLAGRPMLAHVIDRLRPQCAALALNANGDPSRFARFRLPVIADDPPVFAGPLAGVLAGLEFCAAGAPPMTHVATLAADTPFAPRDLVVRLDAARQTSGAAIAGLVRQDHSWNERRRPGLRNPMRAFVDGEIGADAMPDAVVEIEPGAPEG